MHLNYRPVCSSHVVGPYSRPLVQAGGGDAISKRPGNDDVITRQIANFESNRPRIAGSSALRPELEAQAVGNVRPPITAKTQRISEVWHICPLFLLNNAHAGQARVTEA